VAEMLQRNAQFSRLATRGFHQAMLWCLLWVVMSCSAASSSLSSQENQGTTDTTIDQLIQNDEIVSFNFASGSNTVTLDNLSVDEDVVLVLVANEESDNSFGIQISSDENSLESLTGSAGFGVSLNDHTESFHEKLREAEQDFNSLPTADSFGFQAALSSESDPEIGSEDEFYVLSSFSDLSESVTVEATLRYQDEFFNFYLDNDVSEILSDAQIEVLCENFSDVIDDMHDVFGEESDVNSDGRFDVLATPIVNGLSGSSASITTGYWFARDLYNVEDSNQREIFYMAVPDPSGEYGARISVDFALSNIMRGVLPHEFQHMINYNQRVNVEGVSSEAAWLNEALSHLAEDIYERDDDGYMVATGVENPARVRVYLNSVADTCFVCGTSLAQRGGSYLFLRYLYEQAHQGELEFSEDHIDFVDNLLHSDQTGVDNIANAVFGHANDGDFQELLGQFALAIYFSQSGLTDDPVYNFDGIDLRGFQRDNRNTILQGPRVTTVNGLSLVDAMTRASVMYLQISGADLLQNGSTITINNSDDGELSGFLLRFDE